MIHRSLKWTKVTTRLPRPRTWPGAYLVTDGKKIWVEEQHPSWWNHKDKRGREHDGAKVTHWMRLPEKPRA
jgi:hypothetical protein